MRIKICGVTRLEDALAAARLGADALGFNFWPGSKRHVTAGRGPARSSRRLPPFVTPVGVFVNQSEGEMRAIAAESGIQVFQLHGDEPPELCARLPLPVVKAIPVDQVADALEAALLRGPGLPPRRARRAATAAAASPSTGRSPRGSPRWRRSSWPAASRRRTWPTPSAAVRPWAVDVASGVESSPGVKDADRMSRFVAAVREVRLP